MQIVNVTATYRELRSSGYPNFSNRAFEIGYLAVIGEDEDADACTRELMEKAIGKVSELHGDGETQVTITRKKIEKVETEVESETSW